MTGTAHRNAVDTVEERFVTAFREDGFAHVPGVLTADEVAFYREIALEAIAREGVVAGMGLGVGRTAVMTTVDAFWQHETLRGLARHPRVGAVAQRLAGLPLRVWGGEALIKSAGDDSPTLWHEDRTFVPLESRLVLNAWIALVDVPAERGCLTFMPGSHRRGGPVRATLDLAKEHGDQYLFQVWPDLAWSPRTTVPLRAGDVTFHQWRTGHTAGGNTSDGSRIAFITTYTDAEATYHPHPGHETPGVEPGRVPPGDRYPAVADLG